MATTSLPTTAALASSVPSSRLRAPLASSVMVALDIDGTLLGAGWEVPRETRIAVKALRLAGHHVVLASGRSLAGVLPVARSLGLAHGWAIASNGAVTARLNPLAPGEHTIQEATTFDPEPVARLVAAQLPETQIAVEETGWGYRTSTPVPDEVINGRQRLVAFEELWIKPTPRVFLRGAGVLDLLDPLRALGVTATTGGPTWVDVTPPDLSSPGFDGDIEDPEGSGAWLHHGSTPT
ncbi:HAD family hydrolase, partial [Promicromonospora xylanilytica]